MTSHKLDNLVKIGELKEEPFNQVEFDGLVTSARRLLADAQIESLSLEGRFGLTYNAAHAVALAALRRKGFRSKNRYLVFQCLQMTLGMESEAIQVLALCHRRRNVAEYEGHFQVEDRLVTDLLELTKSMLDKVTELDAAG